MKILPCIFFLLPFSTFCLSQGAHARLNTITAGITTSYDNSTTNYDREGIEEPQLMQKDSLQQLSIGPLFIFETTSSTDALSISYNPSYVYDLEKSQSDLDHRFSLAAHRDFTRRLRIEINDNFIYSNDPDLLEADISSDYNRGRKRYWKNTARIDSSYTYDTASSFGMGYSYEILRNEDTGIGGYEDYDRHVLDLSLEHKINSAWNFSLFSAYTRGLFDSPDQDLVNTEELSSDLSEYTLGGTVNWVVSARKTFYSSYNFSATRYDALLRPDTNLHNLILGAQYQYTKRLSFDLGAGPSYEKTEGFDANWGYNSHVNFAYDIAEYTNVNAGIEKGYNQNNFSSNNNTLGRDRGLTEFWSFNVDLSHRLTADLSTTLFVSYREETQENIISGFVNTLIEDGDFSTTDRETFREESRFKRKIYEAGASISYSFLQWYTSSFRYTYRNQDSEYLNDSYDEHRAFLTLSFQKELLRW